MNVIAFDTLKVPRQLTDAGLEPRTAEGVSSTLAGVIADREDLLVTKTDLRLEMARIEAGIDGQGDKLRAEMRAIANDQLWKIIGAVLAVNGLFFAAGRVFGGP